MAEAKLNIQAMARQDEGLMSCLLSDEGYTTVSVDLSAGEPTVMSHYSNDKNYRYAAFDGVGKKPFFNAKGLLMIDDIYLMLASINPVSSNKIKEVFEANYDGISGFDKWSQDSDYIKKLIKKERGINKICALGIGYSMGPRKLVSSCYDKGFVISFEQAKVVHHAYWNTLFPDVAKLRDYLAIQTKQKGFLVNPFGFRIIPEPHKALNYFIQSSVNGIMDILLIKLLDKAPYIKFRTIVHDELIIDIPETLIREAQTAMNESVKELNKMLNWSVNVRTGWVEGRNYFEAH